MKHYNFKKTIDEIWSNIQDTVISLLCWILGYPLTFIIRRDPKLTCVLIRSGSMFADNAKYFFVYANELKTSSERVVLLTSNSCLHDLIVGAGADAVMHPRFRSLILLMRCGTIITDLLVTSYYPLIRRGRFVQIWHGAPLKHIELDLFKKRLASLSALPRLFLRMQKRLISRYPTYDIVISTSQKFIDTAFRHCFKSKIFAATGYPRNDILFGWPEEGSLSWHLARINVDLQAIQRVKQAANEGKIICLYAPTYRKSLNNPFDSAIDLERLSSFASLNNILIVMKLHPVMQGRYEFSRYSNILVYNSAGDVYPLMPLCHLLITDYSSIYFDFLLLDKPIIFFAYDLDSYLEEDSNMYFDYHAVTPGPKCSNQEELENRIEGIIAVNSEDPYEDFRHEIRTFTHDNLDNNSCRRIIEKFLRTCEPEPNDTL